MKFRLPAEEFWTASSSFPPIRTSHCTIRSNLDSSCLSLRSYRHSKHEAVSVPMSCVCLWSSDGPPNERVHAALVEASPEDDRVLTGTTLRQRQRPARYRISSATPYLRGSPASCARHYTECEYTVEQRQRAAAT